MKIEVKDKQTGKVYSNDFGVDHGQSILEIHFCTSYTQVVVQDVIPVGDKLSYPAKSLILPPLGSKPNPIDLIATDGDHEGEWINPV